MTINQWLRNRTHAWVLALLVAAIAWALYVPALSAGFVYDGRAKVLDNPYIHDRANFGAVLTRRVMRQDVLDNNRPANLLSLMVDSVFWGKNPAGYHATSITLHAAVCAMLFLLLARLLPEDGAWPAFGAAIVFAVHPLNCEAVSEVSYREDLLVAASMLVALFAAIGFMRKPGLRRNLLLGAICCGALLFGVAAKENGAAGPVVLAAYWLLWRRKESAFAWGGLVAAACLVVAGFLVARFTLAPEHSVIFTSKPVRLGGTLANTLMIQPRIWAMQFLQVIVPRRLCADYGGYSLRNFSPWASMLAVGLIIAGQLWFAFRDRVFALGTVWFWAALAPVSNLVPIYRPMADRFLYVPLAGAALLLACALFHARAMPWGRIAIWAALIFWLGGASAATWRRERVWHDSLSLWRDTALRNPRSETAADNLGWALLATNRAAPAAASFQQAIRLTHGRMADAWAGLALANDAAGKTAAADDDFQRAVALDARYGRPQELVRALVIEPDVAGKLELLANRNTNP